MAKRSDRLEAVTVSVGYSDFLRVTAPWCRHHFDKWVVVTSPDDVATKRVCWEFGMKCVVTEDHRRDGTFSKGRCVERGLHHLSADCWVLHLDADIVLPRTFRDDLQRAHLRDDCVHGFDRVMVRSPAEWDRLVASGWLDRASRWHPHAVDFPPGFPVGARWAGSDGYVPIGFAQLWHRIGGEEELWGARFRDYPRDHGSAARGDVQHGLQWDRRKRALVPEVIVAHIESEACRTGANWRGRATKPFPASSSAPS